MQQRNNPDFTILFLGIIILLVAIVSSCKVPVKCSKCNEVNCIYQAIESKVKDKTDIGYYNAIMEVSRERKLTDQQTEMLFTEYYL